MKSFKGMVKDNVILLEDGAQLPNGTIVEVRVKYDPEREAKLLEKRRAAFQRILDNPIAQYVGIDEIIEEDKQEREEHPDTWLSHRS